MFKRQIILLALLEEFGGELPSTELMKYLFLLTRNQVKKSYHFVPYKFGCFSFQAYSDKRTLIHKGVLKDTDEWKLTNNQREFADLLSKEENFLIKDIKDNFGHFKGEDLIKFVYLKYPYYAIKSEILDEVLNKSEVTRIKRHAPKKSGYALFTIGYEGRSLEEYINCLIKEDIRILCDLRKNPLSRKYGFSKTTLKKSLESIGINYIHFPGLGISSEKRENLNTPDDYNRLLNRYDKDILDNRNDLLKTIYQLLQKNKRIALTCFEKDPNFCHRSRVAKAVSRLTINIPVKNL